MADTQGQQDIRGQKRDLLVKGFADEELVFKSHVTVTSTGNREIIWYQKTAGFLSEVTTSGMTTNLGANMSHGSRPTVLQQTWTRNTSYVKTFFFESPLISEQDMKDNDVMVMATHLRDVTRKVLKDMNDHIYNIMTENQSPTNILSTASTAAWDAASGQKIVTDIETGKRKIRVNNYEPTHIFLSPTDYASMIIHFIETEGANIPGFTSQRVQDGVIEEILGLRVIVSNSVAADSCAIAAPSRAVTYYEFTPLKSGEVVEDMIGTKVRVKTEGIATLTDPKAVHLTTNTQA